MSENIDAIEEASSLLEGFTVESLIQNFYEWITTSGIRLVIGLIALVIGWRVVKRVVKVTSKVLEKRDVNVTLRSFLEGAIGIVLKLILILMFMEYVGLKMTGLAAVFASAGIGIGLAVQGSLSNLAGGVVILFIRPFNVGDYIDGAGLSGTVERIGMFYTNLLTIDNKVVLIPNGTLANGNIVNYTTKPQRRVDLTFSVAYEEDVYKVKGILTKIVYANELILKDPEPFVGVSEHAASSVNFIVRAWCNTEDYWTVYYELLEKVKIKFDEEQVVIPYPQMDVHIKERKKEE